MKLIVSSDYKELIRFLFSNLRYETTFPLRDGFFLAKTLSHKESTQLERFKSYVIVSKTFFTQVWGREEIYQWCMANTQTRKKKTPDLESLSDEEFEKYIKVFYVTGVWEHDESDGKLFPLFTNIDNRAVRNKEYFVVRKDANATAVLYALLTFVNKSLSFDSDSSNVKAGYFALLKSKNKVVTRNIYSATKRLSQWHKDVDPDMKTLRFLTDIGRGV